MKKLLLLALLIVGCNGADTGTIVETFHQDGKTCLYITDNYGNYDTGLYCKEN